MKRLIDAYYEIKNQIHHSMTCGIPHRECDCGVDKFQALIADIQEAADHPVPPGVCYSVSHRNFFAMDTGQGMGIDFWNSWRQYAAKFPQR